MSLLRLSDKKKSSFYLASLFVSVSLFLSLSQLLRASFHILKSPMYKPACHRTDIPIGQPARTRGLPTATQLSSGLDLKAINSHGNELGSGSFPV